MRLAVVLLVAVCLLLSTSADAYLNREIPIKCPLCEKEFRTTIDISGSQFGMRLDLKPLGMIPAPLRIPVCSGCRFVIWNDHLEEDQLILCRSIVHSDNYQRHRNRESYFLLGLLFEELQKDDLLTAMAFLKASWQVEANEEMHRQDLQLALKHFERYFENPEDRGESWQRFQFVKGDLLRQLKRFDEAAQHFKGLLEMKEFQIGFKPLVQYELQLIADKDNKPHEIPETEDESGENSNITPLGKRQGIWIRFPF